MRVIQYKEGFYHNINVSPEEYTIKLRQEAIGSIVGDSPDAITIIITFKESPEILYGVVKFEYKHYYELPDVAMFEATKIMRGICTGADTIRFDFIIQTFKTRIIEILNEKFPSS